MRTGKKKTITNNGLYGNAAIISGNTLYYIEYCNMKKEIYKLIIYDLKTSKKKTVKKNLPVPYCWIDKNHYYMVNYNDGYVYLFNSKTGKKSVY